MTSKPSLLVILSVKGVGRKFSRGGGATEKIPKISKKYRKIALFSLFQRGGNGKKTEKYFSTLSIP